MRGGGTPKGPRSSNLELLRIIAMLTIVAHHYVVNSGVQTNYYGGDTMATNMVFLQFWGMWGKTAINAFVMITGYFMCTSQLTVRRFAKIYLEAKFYRVAIFVILAVLGWQAITLKELFKCFFCFIYEINSLFTGSFLAFYLFIPFYNILINGMKKEQMQKLIGLLLLVSTIASTFFFSARAFTEVGWYMTLYFIAAYIRLYPMDWMGDNRICGGVLFGTALLSYLSVMLIDILTIRIGIGVKGYYYMVSDSNKLFALIIGVFAFLFFKNLKMGYSKVINLVASTTFGVLCIHASSDAMRTFLWKHLLNVEGMYNAPLGMLMLHAVLSMIAVFCICSLIDLIRIRWIEKPALNWVDKMMRKTAKK
jgi:hypothetical protein